MAIHSHHDLLEHEVLDEAQRTKARTWQVSLSLLGTLLGGALLVNSWLAEYIFDYGENHAKIMAMVGAILLASPVIWHAFVSLVTGHSHMDELVALAIVAAFAIGEYRTAGAVAFFMLLAELVETRTALGARASIESLIRITPTTAKVLDEEGHEREVDTSALEPGQVVRVRPGDNIPADGEVISGESSVNQATITGESLPVDKAVDSQVFAGTTNLTGMLDIRVAKAGRDTTLGKVQSMILQAESTKIPIMRIIDRYVHWYTPTMLMLAGVIFAFTNIERAIAALIIACPCALILATPTAMVAALSCAARLGILVKNVSDLEQAGRLNAVVFDKTGTLTTGQLAVTRLTPAEGVDAADMLKCAASAEQFSKHPTAQALLQVAKKAKLSLARPEGFAEVSGRGVRGSLDGADVLVGRQTWLAEQGVDMSPVAGEAMQAPEGISLLYVARGGRCIGWIGMEDRTREEARQAIEDLAELGVRRLVMVTGDRLAVARRVAAEMGCNEVKAEVLPDEKLHLVHELQEAGYRVAVVGDGVNDAPALAAGDLGVAMGAAGSDVAINSASIALMSDDLGRLPFLVKLSRVTRKVVIQNLAFGVLFIVTGLIVAGKGWIPPVLAVILHLAGSLVIVFNSARLVRFGEELAPHTESVRPGAATAVPQAGAPGAVPAV